MAEFWNPGAAMKLGSAMATRERFLLLLGVAALAYAALAYYEYHALGWYPVREEPAGFSAFHWVRIGFSALVSLLLVTTLTASPRRPSPTEPMLPAARFAAIGATALALATTVLFLADPIAFHALSLEDGSVEDVSELALLLACGIFAVHFVNGLRRRGSWPQRLDQLVMLGLAAVLFVVAMEEISWGQRLFHFGTPERLSELNWQHEFNLHNIQTDLSETVYYVGAALFLIFVPLVAATLGDWGPLEFLRRFAPGRSTAVAAAPISIFNYGHWNLVPIQVTSILTPLVLLAFARMAAWDGQARDALLLRVVAVAVVVGQVLFLALGPHMLQVYDATEYKEMFIALGFGWYAVDWALRMRRETVYLTQ